VHDAEYPNRIVGANNELMQENFPATFLYVAFANGLHDDLLKKHVIQPENS
jgi:hypothetical protein